MRALAIGLLAAATLGLAVPASAEEVVVRGPGVGIDIGHRDRDVTVEHRYHRDRDYARGNCKTTIIKRDGMTKKIRRCD